MGLFQPKFFYDSVSACRRDVLALCSPWKATQKPANSRDLISILSLVLFPQASFHQQWDMCLWRKTLVTKFFFQIACSEISIAHCFPDSYSQRVFVLSWICEAGTNPALHIVGVGLFSWQEMPCLERRGCAAWLWAALHLSLVWCGVCTARWWDAASHGGACQIGWKVRSSCRCVFLCLNIGIFAGHRLTEVQGCPNSGPS